MENVTCFDDVCKKEICANCPCRIDQCEVKPTAMVMTPFFRPLGTNFPEPTDCTIEYSPNYDEYDLFCLRTKMDLYIHQNISKSVTSVFAGYEFEDKVQLFLNCMEGGDFIPISEEMAQGLQNKVNQYVQYDRYHCLLISVYEALSEDVPIAWLQSILPSIELDSKYDQFYEDGALFIKLDHNQPYNDQYDKLLMQVTQILEVMYQQGVIFLDLDLHRKFITDWNMIAILGSVNLYRPNWNNGLLAPNLVSFLNDRFAGRNLCVSVGSNSLHRHDLAKRFSQAWYDFYFSQDDLCLRNVTTYSEILAITNLLSENTQKKLEKVIVIPISNIGVYNLLAHKIKERWPESDIVMYQINARPKNVISFSVPLSEPDIDIRELLV